MLYYPILQSLIIRPFSCCRKKREFQHTDGIFRGSYLTPLWNYKQISHQPHQFQPEYPSRILLCQIGRDHDMRFLNQHL